MNGTETIWLLKHYEWRLTGSHNWHWTKCTPLVPIHMSGTELIWLFWIPHTLLAWLPAMFAHKPCWRSAAGLRDMLFSQRDKLRKRLASKGIDYDFPWFVSLVLLGLVATSVDHVNWQWLNVCYGYLISSHLNTVVTVSALILCKYEFEA